MNQTQSLTADELFAAGLELPADDPMVICNVSQTIFSLARHYGGITYQGKLYTYNHAADELVRGDVLKWVTKRRKEEAKARKLAGPVEDQTELFK